MASAYEHRLRTNLAKQKKRGGWIGRVFWVGLILPFLVMIVAAMFPGVFRWVFLALAVLGAIAVFKPMPRLNLGQRASAISLLYVCAIGAACGFAVKTEAELLMLKSQDPDAYLAYLKDFSDDKYDDALKELRPEQYQALIKSRVAQREQTARQKSFVKSDEKQAAECISSWDGSLPALKSLVKRNLRNPKSFKHIETGYTVGNDGHSVVGMRYRAENGFGGMTVGNVVARMRNDNCSFEVIASD
ncbi:MAG: hypothetical protein AAF850_03415 [Pseudomonadota bacterium]